MKFVLALFLPLMIVSCNENTVTPATYGTISGVVYAPDGKTPVGGASITTNPPTSAIATDPSGAFVISDVTVGKYTVTASKAGYSQTSVSVEVTSRKTVQAVIFLGSSSKSNPSAPTEPTPSNQATDQPLTLTLSWHNPMSVQAVPDTVHYNVYLYQSGSTLPNLIASNIMDTSTTVTSLKLGTTYFWQVVAVGSDTITANSDIWSFTTISAPNNPLVFARQVNGEYQIFSSDTGMASAFQLTDNNSRNWWPRINPRHDIIAFTSDRNVEPQIYTMDFSGGNVFQVTSVGVTGYGNYGIGFCWSPDGASLLYAHNNKLYKVRSDGGDLTVIATAPSGTNFRECSYSPQGNRIAVLTVGPNVYDSEIYIMNADGSNMTLLVPNSPGATADPTFSPDGKSILYTHDVSGFQDSSGRVMDSDIFRIDIGTGQSENLSVNTGFAGDNKKAGTNDLDPRYSPDGAYIIFDNGPNTPNSEKNIWVMNSDASGANDNGRHEIIQDGVMPDWK